ncbi:alpha/beta-hydrolase, partial [Lojkania enalia]
SSKPGATKIIPSPRRTLLPHLSEDDIKSLPYPLDALPGPRDVDSPYGTTRVYEWGPEQGPKVLLIHGISTPSIALGTLAHKLVEKGCRVMLFDLFGRGYSSSPSPTMYAYDSSLYTSQILLVLSSSPLPWTSFTLIGYSLGGAIAADFTSYFPHLIYGLVLIAPGGLIRTSHISWRSKILYETRGLIPEWLVEKLVSRRLWTGPESARVIEPEAKCSVEIEKQGHNEEEVRVKGSQAVYQSSHKRLLPSNPHSTVGKVVDWQVLHHAGFVKAFISSIRHAPIHNQHHRWRVIGEHMTNGKGALKMVDFVLGEQDPIIVANEILEDARGVLGEKFMRVEVVQRAGHEVPIERPDVVV